jgi:hypothetical protein
MIFSIKNLIINLERERKTKKQIISIFCKFNFRTSKSSSPDFNVPSIPIGPSRNNARI